jgi:hypothetical protein
MTDQRTRTGTRSLVHIGGNRALVAMSLIIAILFCELGSRMVGYENPVDFKTPRTGKTPRFFYEADPVNGHDMAKNSAGGVFLLPDYIRTYGAPFPVSSNSLGCRDRPFDPQDGYVLLLGDSFTFGYAALEQTRGAILEQLIGVRALKCGVGGYGPRQERHKLEAVVTRAGRPRFVIVGYVMNDLLDDYLYPHRTVIDGYMINKILLADAMRGGRNVRSDEDLRARLKTLLEPQPIGFIGRAKDLLAAHSILYDLLRNSEALRQVASRLGFAEPPPPLAEIEAYQAVAEFPWLEQAWEEHLENLRQLNSAVEALGATMLVVIFPEARQVYDSLRPQGGNLQWEYPNQRLTEFFQREQIAFVDLLPEFRRYAHRIGSSMANADESLYWAHDGHPNVRGNRLAGFLVGRRVLEGSFVEVDDKNRRLSDVNQLLEAEEHCRLGSASK